jgi:hypothetical protein
MNRAVCQLVRLRSANRRSGLLSESQTAAVTLARFTFGTGQKSELALRVLIQQIFAFPWIASPQYRVDSRAPKFSKRITGEPKPALLLGSG